MVSRNKMSTELDQLLVSVLPLYMYLGSISRPSRLERGD